MRLVAMIDLSTLDAGAWIANSKGKIQKMFMSIFVTDTLIVLDLVFTKHSIILIVGPMVLLDGTIANGFL
tara:strand:+ start:173 stop:382 length:210 start_codon:yes stop_codon:yes gene_type:complete